jgi:hypothetical protein
MSRVINADPAEAWGGVPRVIVVALATVASACGGKTKTVVSTAVHTTTVSAGGKCAAEAYGAKSFVVAFERGRQDCAGATEVWKDYLGRAPTEAQGSGGFLVLHGWKCISARPPERPRIGRCDKEDGAAAFAVTEPGSTTSRANSISLPKHRMP